MGINLFRRSSDFRYAVGAPEPTDPDPTNFHILYAVDIPETHSCVVKIQYPNCTNYEGNKILVYKGLQVRDIQAMNEIDPHFLGGKVSPFARFEPTALGLEAAITLAKLLKD